ncbi:MAG: hypothetical protein Q9159_003320 [Coniocarpon cinnabarinum]
MSSQALHSTLLRPAVIHILRATGFHATKPSVVDALTDLCVRYLLLLAHRTITFAHDRTSTELAELEREGQMPGSMSDALFAPSIADVRSALTSAAFFATGPSASEEAWAEVLRPPLSTFPPGGRDKERHRRDQADTHDVREFVDWATGPVAREMRRVAGLFPDDAANKNINTNPLVPVSSVESPMSKDDYLDSLKKKHGKSGDSTRYQGTVLGKIADDAKVVKIEGGPASLFEWRTALKRKRMINEDT